MIIPNSKHNVRNIRISKSSFKIALASTMAVLICLLASFMYYATSYSYFYASIRSQNSIIAEKDKIISEKENEISRMKSVKKSQDKKIAMLNDNVKKVDSKMKSLDDLERKVRSMLGLNDNLTSRGGVTRTRKSLLDTNTTNEITKEIDNKANDYKNLLSEVSNRLDYLNCLPSSMPVSGPITSNFGGRKSPYGTVSEFHPGIDIAVSEGTPVRAAGKGVVSYAGWLSGYGNAVMINHGYGITSVYGHNSQVLVKVGQAVNRGDIIAKSGSTGRSTGPHVHFEVRLNGSPVDPMKYIK